jgi:ABC-2 type transport system ATP-binding protein
MIETRGLTKRYGDKVAVDDLTFTVQPGIVTGFLGPNGAGKSTTMRMILGLDSPSSGSVTVNGKPYAQHADPLHQVGALLEAKAVHTSRSAYNHLLALAATHKVGKSRVEEVLSLVGLTDVARKRVGAFSLGMGQRLGLAAALLVHPQVLVLDEPVNGLDPEGIRWIRELLRSLADEGCTVFVSSHLMSEMAQTADHVIVVGRGRLKADEPMKDFLSRATNSHVLVRSPDAAALQQFLTGPDVHVSAVDQHQIEVAGMSAATIGQIARDHGLVLHELTPQSASLEDVFMELTASEVEYRA